MNGKIYIYVTFCFCSMDNIKEEFGSELTVERMNSLCSKLLEETVSSTNSLIEVNFAVPEWFAIREDESLNQIKENGVDTQKYSRHLESMMENNADAVYDYGAIGIKFPKNLRKTHLVSLLSSAFHEHLHYINDQFWQEKDVKFHWLDSKWAKEAIAERTVFEHLPNLYKDEFLESAGLTKKDFEIYNQNRIEGAWEGGSANLFLMYLVDAIANPDYVYGKERDLFLDSIKDSHFDPIKSRFNEAVGSFEDPSLGVVEDAFKYLVNAPAPQIALYFFIEQKKDKEINGKNLAQYIKEAHEKGYSAENVKLEKGEVRAEYTIDMMRDFF